MRRNKVAHHPPSSQSPSPSPFAGIIHSSSHVLIGNLSNIHIPADYREALGHPDWKQAMEGEFKDLSMNYMWDLSELPSGKIGCCL